MVSIEVEQPAQCPGNDGVRAGKDIPGIVGRNGHIRLG